MRLLAAASLLLAACGPGRADDSPMLGGRPDRNMVSGERNLPGKFDKKNIKWVADLGNQTYGNPAVTGGRVFIGTNNGNPRDPSVRGDRGVLMCFSEADGNFLWQAVHEKLPTGDAEDYAQIGICSTPCVVGDRVYYISNRAELVCCDAAGFTDGRNDGPIQDEKRNGPRDADLVWVLDMRKDLGIMLSQAAASSPLVVDGRVFVVTGQARDLEKKKVHHPEAPSFIAVDAATGKLLWKDSSPGAGIVEGQWGSPSYGVVDGQPQVAFPGGDGRLYAFDPASGAPLWTFDCIVGEAPDKEKKNHLVSVPVYAGDRVIIAVGQNPENGDGPGCLRAIDARKGAEVWRVEGKEFGRTICTAAVHEGLVYMAELTGYVNCFDLATGKRQWRHDLKSDIWGLGVADGKVYVRTHDGDVAVFRTGREFQKPVLSTLPGLGEGLVVPANGVLYMACATKLYAIK